MSSEAAFERIADASEGIADALGRIADVLEIEAIAHGAAGGALYSGMMEGRDDALLNMLRRHGQWRQ